MSMPGRSLLALLLLGATLCARAELPLKLEGQWIQGGLIRGSAPAGAEVWFEDRKLRLTEQGHFVFGLHRDEGRSVTLKVKSADGTTLAQDYPVTRREYQIQRIDGIDQSKVTPPPETLQRIRSEGAQVRKARHRDSADGAFLSRFIWPAQGPISGVFGSQRVLNGQPRQPHYGVDVALPTGSPVVAPAAGVVSLAHPDMYFSGGTLMIDHGHGLSSAFLHLSKILVKRGQRVEQGELIAEIGATGRVTGPHLDWRVNWFDARVDAALLVPPMPDAAAKD